MLAALLGLSLLLPLTGTATPQRLDPQTLDAPFDEQHELVIEGESRAERLVTLILQVDDARSVNYRTRVNLERRLPPGRFLLRFPLSEWRTQEPRALALGQLKRITLFMADDDPPLLVHSWRLEPGLRLAPTTLALDLGGADSPLMAGFAPLTPGDPRIEGKLTPVLRPAGDALVRDGLRGVERVTMEAPPGTYRLTLWLEEPGEWELLPHPLERAIDVNGERLWEQRLDAQRWQEEYYLVGREEIWPADPWRQLGARQGGRVSLTLVHPGGALVIRPLGHSPDARFLAGLLLRPLNGPADEERVERKRRQLFLERWQVQWPEPVSSPALRLIPQGQASEPEAIAATGSRLLLSYAMMSPAGDESPTLLVTPPEQQGHSLRMVPYLGLWRWQREAAASSLLRLSDDQLQEGLSAVTLPPGLPRRLHLAIQVPADAPPGLYEGAVQLLSKGELVVRPLRIRVLPMTLPEPARQAGIYLELAPALSWFGGDQEAALACDLERLEALGVAPLSPPLPQDPAALGRVGQGLAGHGMSWPLLAYTPLKRWWAQGAAVAIEAVAASERRWRELGLPPLYWSLADEPRPETLTALLAEAALLHRAIPGVRLAAHLNHPSQAPLLAQVDLALINAGFGADREQVERLQGMGKRVWLYNLGTPRAAAGFYLWRSGAEGMIQWHGRMPTARPFDPTDGREQDFLLLGAQSCQRREIGLDLLRLQQGIEDGRWLRWLAQAAQHESEAAALLAQLWQRTPSRWAEAAARPEQQWERDRLAIIGLAARLHSAPVR
ncbi:hypothetical protein [Aeromonas diversa]|uniref:hypothetical protein n=1 Tax=Aeromonas diversa TaxID=502790 RepID=UPI0034628A93